MDCSIYLTPHRPVSVLIPHSSLFWWVLKPAGPQKLPQSARFFDLSRNHPPSSPSPHMNIPFIVSGHQSPHTERSPFPIVSGNHPTQLSVSLHSPHISFVVSGNHPLIPSWRPLFPSLVVARVCSQRSTRT